MTARSGGTAAVIAVLAVAVGAAAAHDRLPPLDPAEANGNRATVLAFAEEGGSTTTLACSGEGDADLAITGAMVIDGTGDAPRTGTTILVRHGRIVAVVPDDRASVPAGATVIDAAGKYVIPGRADMHVHFSLGAPLPRRPGTTEAVLARKLYYGVTSILALGTSDAWTESIREFRARRSAGELEAPYIYGTGGHLTLQGTHPIYTIFPPAGREAADSIAAATPMSEPVNLYSLGIGLSFVRTKEAARKAVRERAEGGMDAIKITVESGPTPFGNHHPQMPVEMIRAIVDEAKQYGMPVLAHVTSLDELEATLEGGAAGVVHAVRNDPLPDGTHADEMAASGFSMSPTLVLFAQPGDFDDPFLRLTVSDQEIAALADPGFIERRRQRWECCAAFDDLLANMGMLHKRGVAVAVGTDTGNPYVFPGYSVHKEMELLVQAGLTPMEAIRAATQRAAGSIGKDDEFGTLEPGKRADLLILGVNPLDDIRNTRSLEVVVSEGRVVDRRALLADVVNGGPGAATGDAVMRQCEFGVVVNLGPAVNSSYFDGSPTVSADEKTLIFTSERMEGRQDLFTSTRRRTEDPWGEAVSLGPTVNHPVAHDFSVRLSQDARSLYFASERPGGFGSSDLYVARRHSPSHPWEPPENLGPGINTEAFEAFPTPSGDGNTLYFNRSTTWDSPDSDIWVTTRATENEPWGAPERLPEPIRGPGADFAPAISADGLTLYFASRDRPGNIGLVDIWVARRRSESAPWGAPENLGTPVNTPRSIAMAPFPSVDGRRLYFMSSRPGGLGGADCDFWNCFDLYVATRTCGDERREQ